MDEDRCPECGSREKTLLNRRILGSEGLSSSVFGCDTCHRFWRVLEEIRAREDIPDARDPDLS